MQRSEERSSEEERNNKLIPIPGSYDAYTDEIEKTILYDLAPKSNSDEKKFIKGQKLFLLCLDLIVDLRH